MDPIAFGIVAACLLLAALFVVTSKNLVHAVLWLAVSLGVTAALYVLLQAPFLAGIQILLYTGGVITLMLFGVMLTRRHERVMIENETAPGRRLPGLLAAAALFGVVAAATTRTSGLPAGPTRMVRADEIGRSFLTEHLLAFEVLSLLLLVAMIGAIVLARKTDYGKARDSVIPVRGEEAT
jgi:NADH-quinone oxidoreductase subunit J